jgi:GT2 family glycosyltransferase
MIPGLVSLFVLTIDRYELTKATLETNLRHAMCHAPMEILVADNGSKDYRIVNYFNKHPLISYHRVNEVNEGVGKAFNQLYLRSKGEYLCFLGNDLELPPRWLREMMDYCNAVENCGVVGMDWGHGSMPPLSSKDGKIAHWLTPQLNRIFGVWFLKRSLVEKLGLFSEEFGPYGLEDSDFNERVNRSGFNSLYVPNTHFKCLHNGVGNHDTGEYRKMKDESMGRNLQIYLKRVAEYDNGAPLFAELPESRLPLGRG